MQIFEVFGNIARNFLLLQSDFIGISFSITGFSHGIISFFLALTLTLIYYLMGRKIRRLLKVNDYKVFNYFIEVALGYIFVNSGLAILGMFSLLYPAVLWIYIIGIFLIAFYPYNIASSRIKIRIKSNKWVFFGIFLFVLIAFIRLIPPETGEDAVGYHTSDPHLFLKNHTTMLLPKAPPYVLPAPHLGEMSYMMFEFLGHKDASRYLHFIFYILVVSLIFIIQPYGALFFVTAPVVIQVSSKANVDFQWILCWIISIIAIARTKNVNLKDSILSGIFYGGMLASKLWTIAFFPLFILFMLIYKKNPLMDKFKNILTFSFCALLINFIWFWRSYAITGSPVYPAFASIERLESFSEPQLMISNYVGFNSLMFSYENAVVFGPIFFMSIIGMLFNVRKTIVTLTKSRFFPFLILIGSEYLIIRYHFGRYLLALYSVTAITIPLGITYILKRYIFYKVIFITVFLILLGYYLTNALLILPYGLGWADSNKYLTRILSRDNSSYYDFDKKFDRWISDKDKVATYETFGFYYANFDYIDINYVFDKKNKSFGELRKHGITKLFIKGGTVEWFCERLKISNCDTDNYELLAQYPSNSKYLYEIKGK